MSRETLEVALFMMPMPGILLNIGLGGIFGLLIGSFLNVVIHRIPIMMQRAHANLVAKQSGHPSPYAGGQYNLVLPRSACPHCQHQITALENIPVMSYLFLGGKCRQCKAPISARYPSIELFAGILSAALAWKYGLGREGFAALTFSYFLIALTCIDVDTQSMPKDLIRTFLWCGLLINLVGTVTPFSTAVLGALAGSMCWMLRGAVCKMDVDDDEFQLFAALGAWLGLESLLMVLFLVFLGRAIAGRSVKVLGSRRGDSNPFPFSAYLSIAGMLVFLYGKHIIQWGQNLTPLFSSV